MGDSRTTHPTDTEQPFNATRPAETDVHVWTVHLDAIDGASSRSLLSEAERRRAARLHGPAAARFVRMRGQLRLVLSGYLNVAPKAIAFQRSATGKPELAEPWAASGLRFSVAHSGDVGVIGVARGRAIGVDVEVARDDLEVERVAERAFTDAELTALRQRRSEDRATTFYRLWTAKEALIKAHGGTVPAGLAHYEVTLQPDGRVTAVHSAGRRSEGHNWRCDVERIRPDVTAAIAVEGPNVNVRWQTPAEVQADGTDPS